MSATGLSTEDCALLFHACEELKRQRLEQAVGAEMECTRTQARREARRYHWLAHAFRHAKSAAIVSREVE